MQEIFAQFPIPPQQPATIGGQIFAVHSQPMPTISEPLTRELATVVVKSLNPRQIQILEELTVYQPATADLLLRKFRMKPGALRHLQKLIYAMYDPDKPENCYVEFLYPPKHNPSRFGGSSPYVVTLGRKGYKYLRDHGHAVGRYRDHTNWVHEPFPLRHRLATSEFLLKAQLLETEQTPEVRETGIQLVQFRTEKYWNANPLKVHIPDAEKPQGLSPDLLTAFQTHSPRDSFWLLPEINLTEMWRRDWEAKVYLYRYCMPAYRARFGTSILTTIPVMVASPTSFPRRIYARITAEDRKEREREAVQRHKRMLNLLKWTEGILEKRNMRHEADLFSFSSAPLDELTPTELFFTPHWIIPFSDTPRLLLPIRKEAYD